IRKTGASIHDNTATENGGGIYLAHGQLDMEGGKITGNSAKLGSGVYYGGEKEGDQPTFRVAGTVEVSGNQGGNVYLTDGMLINNGNTNTSLDDKSVIWVTTEIKPAEGAPVTIAKPFKDDENKSAVFKSDGPYQVQWDDAEKEVQLVVPDKFVVEYDPNDGTLPDDVKFQFYDKAGTATIKDMPEPSREGYKFLGWFTDPTDGEKITEEDNVPVKSNMTLYAHWEEIVETFKVTYNANGGSGTMRGHTEVLPDEEITLKQNGFTAPSGMEFNYWAVGSTSGEQKNPGDKITVAKDTTVYAIWKTKSNPSEPSKPSRPSGGGSSGGGSSSSSTLTITSSAGTGGSISPKGRVEVKRGSDKTYTITAQSGYVISDVLVDGKSVGARSSYTFEDIRRSHTIKAVFTKSAQQTQQPAQPAVTTPSTTTAGSCPRDASCPIAPFNDAQPTAWYHDGVHACIANGLMTGTGNGHFEPSTPLSRGMLAQILYNREGKPAVGGGSTFPDVPAGAWYENAVKRASATGIVAGYENGSYGPGDAVTREQLVVILWRHAGSPVPINSTPFSDFNDTREYARDAVRWAYGSSIISGKEGNRFDPSGRASRAEVAQMLKNYFML
ncbi:MAG: S-layer homology domain-containing protein, partial [Eubacteriales bacterium]|nr:S-layer homology domain-containing protein [Eubacteriales bacterium]